MDKTSPAYKQVQLLVRTLPYVAKQPCFALKGGTAINLFLRNLPRLSVDIDLNYLPLEDRETSINNIKYALGKIQEDIQSAIPKIQIQSTNPKQTDSLNLSIRNHEGIQIKIEVSPVLRGTVFPPTAMETTNAVQEEFGFAEIQVVSFYDLYAGKICAALDRQHPRDIFDVHLLFENEGINHDLIRTFLVYLVSHNRPMSELLSPSYKNIRHSFEHEFRGMTREEIAFEKLDGVLRHLVETIHRTLTNEDREFLMSVKRMEPQWALLGLEGVEKLPAVSWKLRNLGKMDKGKHKKALQRLNDVLKKYKVDT